MQQSNNHSLIHLGEKLNYPAGISITNHSNITIKNCNISAFWYGVDITFSGGNTITDNLIFYNIQGISIWLSQGDNNISNNIIYSNYGDGIEISASSYNVIASNNASGNVVGINIYHSSSLHNNIIEGFE